MNKKFVYQVGNNKKVILRRTANQISRLPIHVCTLPSVSTTYIFIIRCQYL